MDREIPYSAGKIARLLVISAVFVATGAFLLVLEPGSADRTPWLPRAAGLLSIVMFGGFGALYWVRLWSKEPGIVLTRRGLRNHACSGTDELVPWSDVTDIRSYCSSGQRMLILEVRDPEKYIRRGNLYRQYLNRLNYRMSGSPLFVSAGMLDIQLDQLEALIREYWAAGAHLQDEAAQHCGLSSADGIQTTQSRP